MRVEWDERKRLANIAKHGLDFAEFASGFDCASAVRVETKPSRTGRSRFKLIGWLDGRLVVVAILPPLGSEALSLVSLRPAGPKDGILHAQSS
ncbi:BrnT family toxin [Methylobacterium sp. JK268]